MKKNQVNFKSTYERRKKELLSNEEICKENRDLFARFFEFEEHKLKRKNNLRELDNSAYKSLCYYICRFITINRWFNDKPWEFLTKEDISQVYNDLEDGKIKKKDGKPYTELRKGYYDKVIKSKPFEMAGKLEIAQEVIQYSTSRPKEVRFFTEETLRKLVDNTFKSRNRLLLWVGFDIGENVNSLIQLRKRDFTRQANPYTKEPEYMVNLRREILKRSRKARTEITNYRETVNLLDQELANLKDDDLVFDFGYYDAKDILNRAVARTGARCIPNGEHITWKDLRNSMACDLLKKGYTTDEVNARLGHKPSSDEIDVYVNFLAIDRHMPKKKVQQFEMEKLNDELNLIKEKEKLEAKRNEILQGQLRRQEEQLKEVSTQFNKINEFMNLLTKNDPEVVEFLSEKAKRIGVKLN